MKRAVRAPLRVYTEFYSPLAIFATEMRYRGEVVSKNDAPTSFDAAVSSTTDRGLGMVGHRTRAVAPS
jgi:hypothetical protein